MEAQAILLIVLVVLLAAVLMSGFPVAFALMGVSLAVALIGIGLSTTFGMDLGRLDWSYVTLFPDRIHGVMTNEVLLAVPLFVFMGVMLERSRVAEDLLESLGILFGRFRGGLGISVTIVGALLAASTGIVGATVATMGLISLPTMMKRGYDPGFASGSIAAAGTLGQIIPPSIVLVILSDVISNAWQEAQREMGVFSPQPVSVGDLFMGALLPGFMLVGLYILYQLGVAIFRPHHSPAIELDEAAPPIGRVLGALLGPILLIVAVLGSILAGIATPTQAAAVGAIGAIFLAGLRANPRQRTLQLGLLATILLLILPAMSDGLSQFITRPAFSILAVMTVFGIWRALQATWRSGALKEVMDSALKVNVMIFGVLIGAALFSLVFRGLGGDHYIEQLLTGLPGGKTGALIAVMFAIFILGFFLDFIEITFVVVPIVAPVLFMMGIDPVWLGVMIAINLQTSFLTPPFGFALFYLRAVAPEGLRTVQLYRGIIPFVAIQILALFIVASYPGLATWLPKVVFGN